MPATHKLIIKKNEFKEVFKEHNNLDKMKIKIGLFGEGKPDKNVAARGIIHELGADIKITKKMRKFLHAIGIHIKKETLYIKIPSRPFMRFGFDNNFNKNINFIGRSYKSFLNDKISLRNFVNKIGVMHVGQIKESIKKGNYTPLHPITIKRKKSTRPLIHTAVMRNSVKYKLTKSI